MLLGLCEVMGHHLFAHLSGGNFGYPAKLSLGLGRVAQQSVDFGWAEVMRVDFDHRLVVPVAHLIDALAFPAQLHAKLVGAPLDELAHAVLLACGNHKVFGLVLLQHHPLHTHVVFSVAPVAQGVDIAHVQAVFQALADVG